MPTNLRSSAALADVVIAARLIRSLPSFLRHRLTLDEARATLRRRHANREADFLTLARRGIYEHGRSPYRELLRLASCEYGDLERLVRECGVEGALGVLYRHGVYLTVDEFKGRRSVIRGTTTIEVNPDRLRNPLSAWHLVARSSGSRGEPSSIVMDLAFIRDCAVNTLLALDARGGADWVKAIWQAPGGGAMFRLLKYSSFGTPVARWFSLADVNAPGLPRYRWLVRLIGWESRLVKVPLPSPEHAAVDDPLPIARWMSAILRSGRTPHLRALVGPAVRLCLAALEAGIDLHGAQLELAGEPTTEARLATIHRAGAKASPRYGTIETGPVGYGCLQPTTADDVHVCDDLHAVIQPGSEGGRHGFPNDALLLSSLCSTAPFILLNVSMGDQAVMSPRACGCPLERLGWGTHLHTIRSYEKLTGVGVTFLDTDVVRVLEEVLPGRFGGAPTDYQIVEEETDLGHSRVRLLVHPAVGPLDDATVAEAFLAAIAAGSTSARLMTEVWRAAEVLRVERRVPMRTTTGKIHHLVSGPQREGPTRPE